MSLPKIIPAEAYCAVGPDGRIDIDLVRRNPASAHSAAGNVHGLPWPRMVGKGWRVIPVRVLPAGDVEAEVSAPTLTRAPSKPRSVRRPPPDPPLDPSYHLTDGDYLRLAATMAGKARSSVPMLRCGEKRR